MSLLAISVRATLSRDWPLCSDSTASNEADTGNFSSHARLDLAKFRSPLSFLMEHYFTSVESPLHPAGLVNRRGCLTESWTHAKSGPLDLAARGLLGRIGRCSLCAANTDSER